MCSSKSSPPEIQEESDRQNTWSELSSDIAELVFSKLPEASLCRAGSVCKQWYSVTQRPTFCEFYKKKKIRNSCSTLVYNVHGTNYRFAENSYDQGGFLIRPVKKLYNVPTVPCSKDGDVPTIEAAGGVHLAYTGAKQTILRYKLSLVEKKWRTTAEMPYFVEDPIVGIVEGTVDGSGYQLVVAGGVPDLSEIEEELGVRIYDENNDSWEYCEPLPSEFSSFTSSLFMAAVVHNNRFYVYDMFSGLVSWLDVNSKRWSTVVAVRPSKEVNQLFLVSRSGALYLVGIEGDSKQETSFVVWSIEDESEATMRLGEIVYSTVFSNTSGGQDLSTIQRGTSLAVEFFTAIIEAILLLLIQFLVHCFRESKRTYSFILSLLISIVSPLREQKPTIRLGRDRVGRA